MNKSTITKKENKYFWIKIPLSGVPIFWPYKIPGEVHYLGRGFGRVFVSISTGEHLVQINTTQMFPVFIGYEEWGRSKKQNAKLSQNRHKPNKTPST